ncbi:MotA/TolQ/ExbB proton channel family protein [Fulvivirga ligni]|uniref:MotA/TolQ/ExbB proton channel family protein n=1 Tax=Fulvivirga ligni TaxID=2904246 RepID=UPI001F33E955|nr:MotA/TolQ/ExbB proton channel family protein [Fulvivirga ligni]UII23634.1 MotA/TolQ/ExbB proton channel family protein [Fulvivirga ligni]
MSFSEFIIQGGTMFMGPLTIFGLVLLAIIARGGLLISKKAPEKSFVQNNAIINQLSIFILVFGIFGQLLGLFGAFEAIQVMESGTVSAALLAGGLKVSMLPTLYGTVIFLLGKVGLIILTAIYKK